MKLIPLTQGKKAMVDDEDFERLSAFKWYAWKVPNTVNKFYARRNGKHKNGKQFTILLHHAVMRSLQMFDHHDRNGLNNQKHNLRASTEMQNKHNASKRRDNSSGFKGVHWHKASKKWCVGIGLDGKRIELGFFTNKRKAAEAYRQASLKYHGEFSIFNRKNTSL